MQFLEQANLADAEQEDVVRAAMLAGLEQYDQALLVHRRRARRNPADPRPLVDAARTMHQRGLSARAAGQLPAFFDHLNRSLATNERAIELAEQALDAQMLVDIYIDQARALIDLDRYGEALARLDTALAQDLSRIEAGLLRRSALRKLQDQQQHELARLAAAAPPDADPGTSAIDLSDLSELIPDAPTLDARDLESAGRGLQSIYRGLQGLLRPPEETKEESAPEGEEGGEEGP
jgi:tetratricopeptide (TPR) repeat protein